MCTSLRGTLCSLPPLAMEFVDGSFVCMHAKTIYKQLQLSSNLKSVLHWWYLQRGTVELGDPNMLLWSVKDVRIFLSFSSFLYLVVKRWLCWLLLGCLHPPRSNLLHRIWSSPFSWRWCSHLPLYPRNCLATWSLDKNGLSLESLLSGSCRTFLRGVFIEGSSLETLTQAISIMYTKSIE